MAVYPGDGVMIENRCGFTSEGAKWYYTHSVQTVLAALDYSVIPFISMLTMNIAIFFKLRQRDKHYNKCATKNDRKSIHGKTKNSNGMSKVISITSESILHNTYLTMLK